MRFTTPHPAIIAHRGASAHAPENTLAAFALALLQGADAIEFDVRATFDGKLVVLHDATLQRTAGDPRAIAEVTSGELMELDGAVRPYTLADVLDCFGSDTRYLIDIKRIPQRCESELIDAIVASGLRERVVVQSSDHLLLRRLSLRDPLLSLAALLPPQADARRSLQLVAPFVTGVVPCSTTTDAALVASARGHGLAISPWTVNEECEMERLIHLGVDALITDIPGIARSLLDAIAQAA
jgi:glycerophosphoryl diester phosphodiesterase